MANPTTNVPVPLFGPNGVVLPTEAAILAGEQADINQAFGGNLNFGTSGGSNTNPTPQGQLATSNTAVIGNSYALFVWYISQIDPAFSQGRMQDAIGRLYFIYRIAGQPTVQPCVCSGLATVVVPIGLLATDNNGNQWICQTQGTISSGGTVTLNFQCVVNGPTVAPTSFTQFQYIPGLDSIAPTGDAVLGNLVETASQFEARRALSVGKNSQGPINSIYGAVAAVPGVVDCYTYSNDTNSPVTIGGVTLNANATYVCFLGGDSQAVAMAAWLGKMPGAPWYSSGNTTETVIDPNPAYAGNGPSYSVKLESATVTAFAVVVTIKNSTGVPSNAAAQVALGSNLNSIGNGIVAGFAGLDGGTRAKIGSTVLASRYYSDVLSLGSWAQVISIQLGLNGVAAQFTGVISGTGLTTSATTGTIAIGQLVQDITGMVAPGTIITAGSGTSWTVSISQTVSSESMTGTTLADEVTVDINQSPSVAQANIFLILV